MRSPNCLSSRGRGVGVFSYGRGLPVFGFVNMKLWGEKLDGIYVG